MRENDSPESSVLAWNMEATARRARNAVMYVKAAESSSCQIGTRLSANRITMTTGDVRGKKLRNTRNGAFVFSASGAIKPNTYPNNRGNKAMKFATPASFIFGTIAPAPAIKLAYKA